MSSIFGGGTSKASRQSVENQQAANAAAQRFIEQQAGLARSDARDLFGQADVALNQGIQGALTMLGQGIDPQLQAIQQGNFAAQQALGTGQSNFQNAILGLPTQAVQPQMLDIDTSFLQNVQMPEFNPVQDAVTPPAAPQVPANFDLNSILSNLATYNRGGGTFGDF